ncbi:MAG TPA: M1 family aminopeptidase [Gemmatimonadota bacterium]|nr:M1 family aminopeptidase [Gemmatimonadota bacterium]
MIGGRFRRVFWLDLRYHLRRPLFWIWLAVLLLLAWGMSTGSVRIQTGDTQVGGTRAWITSEFALAQVLSATIFTFYVFFVAAMAGNAVLQDEEWGIGALLHATPLRAGEYVWAKAAAVAAVLVVVLLVHLGFTAFFNHAVPSVAHADIRGPFRPANYLVPAAVFGLPALVAVGGVSMWVGTRTRKSLLVYLLPLFLIALVAFLWGWSPSWLDPRIDHLLAWIDPSGFRWLRTTWLRVDRGVDFYNTQPIGFDAPFLVSRSAWVAVGVGAVAGTAATFRRRLRGPDAGAAGAERALSAPGAATPGVRAGPVAVPEAAPGAAGPAVDGAPARPAIPAVGEGGRGSAGSPGALRSVLRVARSEVRELLASPALYVFLLLILAQVMGNALVGIGPFDTEVLATPGTVAVRAMDILSLLVCLLLVFYAAEAFERDRSTGVDAISRSLPVGQGAMVVGKCLAAAVLPLLALAGAAVGAVIAILVQGTVAVRLAPFARVWGIGLLPTFLAWIAFLAAVHGLTGSRGATWAVGLGVLGLTVYRQVTGHGTWLTNWLLWDALRWTDMGVLPLNRTPFLLNRLFYLALAVFLLALAAAWGRRREPDAVAWWERLRPGRLAFGTLRLFPLATGPLAVGVVLWWGVAHGFQGPAAEKAASDYWKENVATFWHAATPDLAHVDLDLRLWPAGRRLRSRGSMRLVNREDTTLVRVPVTGGWAWKDVAWTVGGDSASPEERSGLYVFRPDGGLAPGDTLDVGWRFETPYPKGWTRDGGGTSYFVTDAGVVLSTFGPQMMPIPGYLPEIGRTDERHYEARDWPDRFWEGRNPPAFGSGSPFTARVRIEGPPAFTYNSVGRRTSADTADGLVTTVWETDHPVRFFNVVAGRWDAREGTGTRVFYHPAHTYDLDEIASALDAARRDYSEWFAPYPWSELKLSEFPGLATYAQGFPTDITFSEGIGFLAKKGDWNLAPYMVTSHESAHQWWGNMVTPGEGPGGSVLSEGMAHFSTAMLLQAEKGDAVRREFLRRIESDYADSRHPDRERPLVWTDGSRPGDRAVTYDKGGWAFWMLMEEIGRENMLAGLREFIDRYRDGPDYPLLPDLLLLMRSHAPDVDAYNASVQRWFWEVEVPEYRVREARARPDGRGGWATTVRVENLGTGSPEVQLAVTSGTRDTTARSGAAAAHPEADSAASTYREASLAVAVPAGGDTTMVVPSAFRPDRAVVDPDVRVLMLERRAARRDVEVEEGGPAPAADTAARSDTAGGSAPAAGDAAGASGPDTAGGPGDEGDG